MSVNERPRVQVVDDERFYIDLLVEMLSEQYDVLISKNGDQVLRCVSRSHFDPEVIEVFIERQDDFNTIFQHYPD